ncbi:MAG: glycoside hydrolase family 3 N-terminal domain-containing protein [Candidatus Acidiferrales bacterium]
MTHISRAQKLSKKKNQKSPGGSSWVERTLQKMTEAEKLGQLLMVYFFGRATPAESAAYKDLLHEVEGNRVGGLILGTDRGPFGIKRSQVYPTAVLANEMQSRAKTPLLIGADFESGTGMRLDEGTSFPSAMAVAATCDPKLAYEIGKTTALEARAAGIHWIFAPDADVNNNPDNPIINVRSFGEDPQRVADFVAQAVRGIEENGALATAKHFPGHGNVNLDSHLSMAVIPGDRAQLESTELIPFRAAIQACVSSIMPGHLSVPAFEPDPAIPATLSAKLLTGLLRNELGFRGLIVTDAMDMGGVTSLYSQGEAAVRAVEAGADVILQPLAPDAALAGLKDAVKSGRISIERINASVRRILEAKARLGLDKKRDTDVARLNETFGRPEFAAAAQHIADRGVTLLRNSAQVVPLDATRPLRVLHVALSADPDPSPAQGLESEIRSRVDSMKILRADTQFVSVSTLKLPPPESYDVAVAALLVRVADRKGNVGLPDDQRAFVNQLLATGKPCAVVSLGSPYLIEKFPGAKSWLALFSTNEAAQRASVRALFGQVAVEGKIPVTVPGAANRGDGLRVAANPMTLNPAPGAMSDRLKSAFDLLDRAVADGAFPGGVLAVGLRNTCVVRAFGKLSSDANASAVNTETIYDLASLTKPIVTATAVMMLVERKRLALGAPIARLLPEWNSAAKSDPDPAWRELVTMKMLLLHDAGLAAHRDFFLDARSRPHVLARVMAEPLEREPGKQIEYSDLGFILLGEIVERVTGESLDAFAQENIFAPLAMHESFFNPPPALHARIAPTEDDVQFRKRLLHGEVHDENSWAMGGIAGHAGLFSTAADVAAFAQMILNGGIYAHRRLLARATIQEFATRVKIGDSARALGWDVPTEPSSTGRYFSPRSFGHNGFTGTSLWLDPERGLFVVLLTNRVHPTRANEKIRQVRPALHDAVLEALGLATEHAAAR